MKQGCQLWKETLKRYGFSALTVSLLLLLAGYFMENIPYPLFENWLPYTAAEFCKQVLTSSDADDSAFPKDSVLCVDVAYDKCLVPLMEEEIERGNIAITDRSKLLEFLKIVRGVRYKYIVLDIRFEDGVKTQVDSALFQTILSMPNLVLAHHDATDYHIADERLLRKAAIADFPATITTGFTRYQYLKQNNKTIALRMYEDMDDKTISRVGPFFFSGGLCRNSQFILIPKYTYERVLPDGLVKYNLLGHDLLTNSSSSIEQVAKNKIILLGDFHEDNHQTYVGDVPGCWLHFLAYLDLHNRRHIIPPISLLLAIIYASFYLLISFRILRKKETVISIRSPQMAISTLINTRNPKPFWQILISIVCSLMLWGGVFFIIEMFSYILFHSAVSTVVPSLFFTCYSSYLSSL